MATLTNDAVLSEAFGPSEGTALRIKQAVLVVAGIILLALAAKAKVMLPDNPVPITLGTLAVLGLGAAYGPRLGLVTILGYMIVGMAGFDVFAGSSAELNGWAYMTGGTGGYLLGYVLATVALGYFARLGWDRSVVLMAVAMFVGNALIYVPGLAWLAVLYDNPEWLVAKGLTPFLLGDAIKLGIAALTLPLAWKLVGKARG